MIIKNIVFCLLMSFCLVERLQAENTGSKPLTTANLNSELFYQILIGELNAEAGEFGQAYAVILDAARKTELSGLFQRAVDIALDARAGDSALAAAEEWTRTLPGSNKANSYKLQILIGLNRFSDALEPLQRELQQANSESRVTTISRVARYFLQANAKDKTNGLNILKTALSADLKSPDSNISMTAWLTLARLEANSNDFPAATISVKNAINTAPDSSEPIFEAIRLLEGGVKETEDWIKVFFNTHQNPSLQLSYAKVLIRIEKFQQALEETKKITISDPSYIEAWLVKGILELEDSQLIPSEASLAEYIKLAEQQTSGSKSVLIQQGLSQAYRSMSEIAERRQDFLTAERWLQRIKEPGQQFNVQLSRASLLAKQGLVEEARLLIHSLTEATDLQAQQKILAEVRILRDKDEIYTASEVLKLALIRFPNNDDLAYDLALISEKLEDFDEMERLLRKIIHNKPALVGPYNALGYSLADRNIRLNEAKELIEKAVALTPNDPYILDSLAWVNFRLGNLTSALDLLKKAFKSKKDAEIAAHLGEVLWSMGDHNEAIKVWRAGLLLNKNNETLQATLKRLGIDP